jgi:lipopolysaccharide export system permease protein
MKKVHKFILSSYLGPFMLTLFISIFIFFMIFVFKYIDDLVGKGIDADVLIELFTYAALQTIPMALPLSILLSSIMTFGNLGEHYELVALKSSGMSLQKIMAPLIFSMIVICISAFYFSNNVLPIINLKAGSLLFDVTEKKPALQIKESVFYTGIDGFSIRVGKKDPDGVTLQEIMIYDHSKHAGNHKVVVAESGKMEMSADKMFMLLTLRNGYSYEEVIQNYEIQKPHPLLRNQFSEQLIRFDLSDFRLSRTDEDLFKGNYKMLNVSQLNQSIDSLDKKSLARKNELSTQLLQVFYSRVNRIKSISKGNTNQQDILKDQPKLERVRILETATNIARNAKAFIESTVGELNSAAEIKRKQEIEWHKKFTLSFACLVLFFIGAPLGAIIRKGGLGMPVVVSVIFFLIFHILNITGEKFAKEGIIPAYAGMWMSSAVLLPMGVFLTYKATADSALLDTDYYIKSLKKLFSKAKKADEHTSALQ